VLGREPQARNPLTASCSASVRQPRSARSCRIPAIQLNGLYLSGDGITKTTYTYPSLGVTPRFGMAYDPSGQQKIVLRGGGGLFFDRPNGNDIYAQVTNPPAVQNVTVRYAQLQALSAGLSTGRRSDAQRLPVRRKDALVLAMERRRAAGAAVGDGARRGLYRAAQLEHAAGREHQRRRFRRGVPGAEPGPDAGRPAPRQVPRPLPPI
jgi:hypothetical protein